MMPRKHVAHKVDEETGVIATLEIAEPTPVTIPQSGIASGEAVVAVTARASRASTKDGEEDAVVSALKADARAKIALALDAQRVLGRKYFADVIEALARIISHCLMSDSEAIANKHVSELLSDQTNMQSTADTRIMFASATQPFELVRKSPGMSRQLAQLYRKLSAWEAGHYTTDEVQPAGGTAPDPKDTTAVMVWRQDGVVTVTDKWGSGSYHKPVEALRDGRHFSAVYNAFVNVVRPRVVDLGEISTADEAEAFKMAGGRRALGSKEAPEGPRVTLRKKKFLDKDGEQVKSGTTSAPVVAKDKLLRGYIRGLSTAAVRRGTLDADGLRVLFADVMTYVTTHAQSEETEE